MKLQGHRQFSAEHSTIAEAQKIPMIAFGFLGPVIITCDFLDGCRKNPLISASKLAASSSDDLSLSVDALKDNLLGGLLASGFDGGSCLSRYQSVLYRKALQHKPSFHLLGRLRKYEALHKHAVWSKY
ncbi:hypothetical protein AAC387_Pa01g0008 [Persea americana]